MVDESLCLFYSTLVLQGHVLAGIAYGVVLILFLLCSRLLLDRVNSSKDRTRRSVLLLSYVICMFVLCTIMIASNARYVQQLVRSKCELLASGPVPGRFSLFSVVGGIAGDVCYVLANWGVDGVLIWRCMSMYGDSTARRWVTTISAIMGILSFVVGSLLIIDALGFRSLVLYVTVTFWIHSGTSLAINLTITIMIVARLLFYRYRVTSILGSSHGAPFMSVTSMIVESATLVIIFSTSVLILCSLGPSYYVVIPLQALSQMQVVASFWIIFRIAQGKAWSKDNSDDYIMSRSIAFMPSESNNEF
ncbi:hypothetical protein BDQ12DRAFT_740202 [Crucibulum laeve]|uniref:Frag1/DRAM/Sfk1 family-domain-containing protein n=1 Tax=Crucibulum laeve TaxID=68775 RepID=A0A5C3LD72_9AGAR|nr:hypothetical protein BDQ12DRAFT_740202 [Crucibulum laeve]